MSFSNWNCFDTFAWDGGQDGLPSHGTVGLAPYTAVILSQDR